MVLKDIFCLKCSIASDCAAPMNADGKSKSASETC